MIAGLAATSVKLRACAALVTIVTWCDTTRIVPWATSEFGHAALKWSERCWRCRLVNIYAPIYGGVGDVWRRSCHVLIAALLSTPLPLPPPPPPLPLDLLRQSASLRRAARSATRWLHWRARALVMPQRQSLPTAQYSSHRRRDGRDDITSGEVMPAHGAVVDGAGSRRSADDVMFAGVARQPPGWSTSSSAACRRHQRRPWVRINVSLCLIAARQQDHSVLRRWLQLRFDRRSTPIRLQFNHSTLRRTCSGLLHCEPK